MMKHKDRYGILKDGKLPRSVRWHEFVRRMLRRPPPPSLDYEIGSFRGVRIMTTPPDKKAPRP